MQRRSAIDKTGLPAALFKTAPRDVRVNVSGWLMLITAMALGVAGVGGGIVLNQRAAIAERYVRLFESERIVAAGDVIRLQKRGGDDGHNITLHYRYAAGGRELTGATRLRRAEQERYALGQPIGVWYLPSEPEQSWLDGYAPRATERWPAAVVLLACGITAVVLVWVVRRQSHLLGHGRPAMATVTKVEKKSSDEGTVWMVHFEWTTLSGATRTGKYQHGKKDLPAVGAGIPIVYDRDNSFRHSKYPMSLVTIRS